MIAVILALPMAAQQKPVTPTPGRNEVGQTCFPRSAALLAGRAETQVSGIRCQVSKGEDEAFGAGDCGKKTASDTLGMG
jgi:hypothetical protein